MMKYLLIILTLHLCFFTNCQNSPSANQPVLANADSVVNTATSSTNIVEKVPTPLKVGAARLELYLPMLTGKTIGLVVNQTSTIGNDHLVDVLISKGVKIKSIFAPEHGFRGKADAGEKVKSGVDSKTGLSLVSLYGRNKKPSPAMLRGIDLVIFDIQDVGARFYTYISTMHYVMEACAEQGKAVLVLDRPNPNGHFVDGPIRTPKLKSFVGMHPIPIVHGMTVGEIAQMLNGEGWLRGRKRCKLEVIPCDNYDHTTFYELPIKPSPNLPNIRSIYLYPYLCLFEGTVVSVGRGTNKPFQIYGHPQFKIGQYSFTPRPTEGAKNPKLNGQTCYGFDLTTTSLEALRAVKKVDLTPIIEAYRAFPNKKAFFNKNNFFDKLAGTTALRQQIIKGMDAATIYATWQDDLADFKQIRKKYLLYADFE